MKMKNVHHYWSNYANDYYLSLNQENFECDSFLNYRRTVAYPEAYMAYMVFQGGWLQFYSRKTIIEYRNKGFGVSFYSDYSPLYKAKESMGGLPTKFEGNTGHRNAFTKLYDCSLGTASFVKVKLFASKPIKDIENKKWSPLKLIT